MQGLILRAFQLPTSCLPGAWCPLGHAVGLDRLPVLTTFPVCVITLILFACLSVHVRVELCFLNTEC